MDAVKQFVDGHFVTSEGTKTLAMEAYVSYQSWCRDRGIYPEPKTTFPRILQELGYTIRRIGRKKVSVICDVMMTKPSSNDSIYLD